MLYFRNVGRQSKLPAPEDIFMRYNFMNDYNECAHERILSAIADANREQDNSYGLTPAVNGRGR